MTHAAGYAVDIGWAYLEEQIEIYVKDYAFDMGDSDFQRDHVWTEQQQIRYVEYILRGGMSGHDIYTNCINFNALRNIGAMQLVDGKQRLLAVLRFLRNEIPVFEGTYRKDFSDKLFGATNARFRWHVNDLKTRAEVLQWYIEMNAGGTVHTEAEISKVQALLEQERLNPTTHQAMEWSKVTLDFTPSVMDKTTPSRPKKRKAK
jgi:hypothetical protein